MNRLGARLQDVEVARAPILPPLQVHRYGVTGARGIVLLDAHGPARELQHFLLRQHELTPALERHAALRDARRAILGIDELDGLLPALALHDGPEACRQGRLV